MKNLLAIAFLALLMLTVSSSLVLAEEDEDEETESEGQEEGSEQKNQVPGFEAAFALACSFAAAKMLGKAS